MRARDSKFGLPRHHCWAPRASLVASPFSLRETSSCKQVEPGGTRQRHHSPGRAQREPQGYAGLTNLCVRRPVLIFSRSVPTAIVMIPFFQRARILPDVVWPAAAERQPRARSARRGCCRPTGAAAAVKLGRNVRQRELKKETITWAQAGPCKHARNIGLFHLTRCSRTLRARPCKAAYQPLLVAARKRLWLELV